MKSSPVLITPAPGVSLAEQATIDKINSMEQYEMCSLWRFAPAGHPYFDSTKPFAEVFRKRLFDQFGGFTPEISKSLSP